MAEPATDRASDPVATAGDAAAELREAYEELRAVERRIEALGEDRIRETAAAYRKANRVLDSYEDDATGTGDFGAYVRFENEFDAATATGDDALAADAFEAAEEAVSKRRLTAADFDAAREALEPVAEYVDLLEERDAAADTYRAARQDATDALATLRDRLEDLERVAGMTDADLSAPVEELRDPIAGYNEAVGDAFDRFRRGASARELFAFLETSDRYAFVAFDQPPPELREYVAEHPAGEEPLATLLEYADYSPSKLEYYVDDPGALRTTVAVHRTYLDRLDAAPLTLPWPPGAAETLRYRAEELIPLVDRLGDAPVVEEAVVRLREVRAATRRDDYARLRRAAEVREALSPAELDRLESGSIEADLAEARSTISLVEDVLDETER